MREIILTVTVLGVLVLTNCVAVGGLSEEEDLELERQLKVLNKPAIKTIKTEYGDIYDCVDFYKQPAFDHPALKNHDFHFNMKPNIVHRRKARVETEEETKRGRNNRIKTFELIGVGCPHGTVPIRRTTKEDLIRQKNFTKMHDSILRPQTESEPGLHYAGTRVRPEWMGVPIAGGDAHFSLYQTPFVGQLQYSSGLMKISNGSDFIKAGWTVNPTLYGDNLCRLFGFLHTRQQSCFNVNCPGFVLVNSRVPLGYVFPSVSVAGVKPVELRFFIYRDPINGNWWLTLGEKATEIGFWPARIFTDLAYTADDVFWGGEIFGVPEFKTSPMGNGIEVKYDDAELYAYARLISVVDDSDNGTIVELHVENEVITDISWDYVRQNYRSEDKYWGRTIMFGGPGDYFGK